MREAPGNIDAPPLGRLDSSEPPGQFRRLPAAHAREPEAAHAPPPTVGLFEPVAAHAKAGPRLERPSLYLHAAQQRGAAKLDPAAANGSWGFRLLLVPQTIVIWPLALIRLAGGRGQG